MADQLANFTRTTTTARPLGPFEPMNEVVHSIAWILLPLTVIGFVGNAAVLAINFCVRHFSGLHLSLVTNLALSDLLVTSSVLPHLIYYLLSGRVAEEAVCQVLGFMHSILTKASQLTIAIIAYDRYKAVSKRGQSRHSQWHLSYLIACLCFIWMQATVYTTVSLFMVQSQKKSSRYFCIMTNARNWLYALLMFGVCFIESAGIVLFSYTRIIILANQHMRTIHEEEQHDKDRETPAVRQDISALDPSSHPVACQCAHHKESTHSSVNPRPGSRCSRMDTRSNYSVFTITSANSILRHHGESPLEPIGLMAVFLLCWFPIQVENLSTVLKERDENNYHFTTLAIALSLLSSVINPFLYALGRHRYRTTIRTMCRQKSRFSQMMRQQAVARVDFLVNKDCENERRGGQ